MEYGILQFGPRNPKSRLRLESGIKESGIHNIAICFKINMALLYNQFILGKVVKLAESVGLEIGNHVSSKLINLLKILFSRLRKPGIDTEKINSVK